MGRVWHEVRAHSAFQVGNLCVRCGEDVENLEHIVHHCPHWNKERLEPCLPAMAQQVPPCVRFHVLLPPASLLTRKLALVLRQDVDTVWTDGACRHRNNPHYRKCGVGYVTDIGEHRLQGVVCALRAGTLSSQKRARLALTP
eukprot:3605056-Amphidinium_carterae.1